ncbi:ras-related and estrogen-regulated growth inhibitor-like [Diadema setosum]|uniref:ras-related and estrogen-regulated growth inhibitor-like n=1 Tax=Diadema antillarum TaxID=105358 RepID=UPI003A8C3764
MTADLARWSIETQPIITMCGYQQNRRSPEERTAVENLKAGDKMAADARIVVIGEKKVGKSAVTVRFLTRRYIGEYESDSDLLYKQTVLQSDMQMNMEVLDTCTRVDLLKHRDDHVRWGNAFVITYSVCNRDTFRPVEAQIRWLQRCKAPCSVPIAIVGNMVDLEHRREVNPEEGRDLAEEYGCHFFEVSAAEGSAEVREAFLTVLRELHEAKKTKTQIKRRRSSVTRNVANKVMQAVFGSPRRSRKISLP